MNRPGVNALRSIELFPSTTNSLTILPVTGAHKIPQQLCPHAMYAPSTPGTAPKYGTASGGHGLMQLCDRRGPSPPTLALRPPKLLVAAATLDWSGVTADATDKSPPGSNRSSVMYSLPPHPHM